MVFHPQTDRMDCNEAIKLFQCNGSKHKQSHTMCFFFNMLICMDIICMSLSHINRIRFHYLSVVKSVRVKRYRQSILILFIATGLY